MLAVGTAHLWQLLRRHLVTGHPEAFAGRDRCGMMTA
jgi:hypothetical protein